ncbi:MAG: LytTR family DNA-binding domain-containing protein [Muribaculaceae bacterium]|nr:LytTR family DNA-binding domain-containing protein [Muribaculaceae bacterium]
MDNKLKCIVVDDEPLARELMRTYISKTPSLEMAGCFESAAEAVKIVMDGKIDVIFLDINMPMLNGIEFAQVVPISTRIVFVTAYDRYAVEGFRVNALDYLLKPVSYSDFMRSIARALDWKKLYLAASAHKVETLQSGRMVTVKTEGKLMQMHTDTILYIEVRNDRILLFRNEGEPVASLMTLKEIEELLPADSFMRVHRSFIVNIPKVEMVERNRIIFGKTFIPVSESKREEFLSRLGK